MNIFPQQPKLTKSDVHTLLPHTGNVRIPLRAFLDTDPDIDTLKKLILLELEIAKTKSNPRHHVMRGVVRECMKRIQAKELSEVWAKIEKELP